MGFTLGMIVEPAFNFEQLQEVSIIVELTFDVVVFESEVACFLE